MKYPITPPPELVEKWAREVNADVWFHIATQAARWGAADPLERQAAPVPVAVSCWQPISSAPKDGTEILASDCLIIDIVSYGEWSRGVFGWTNREMEDMSPFWWHPLPDHPPLPSGEVEP